MGIASVFQPLYYMGRFGALGGSPSGRPHEDSDETMAAFDDCNLSSYRMLCEQVVEMD